MSAAQATLWELPPEHDTARLREFEVDLTPRGVVRQMIEHILRRWEFKWCARPFARDDQPRRFGDLAPRVLDPCAGAGVFGAELRAALPHAELHAIEVRDEEQAGLERHYSHVTIGDAIAVMRTLPLPVAFETPEAINEDRKNPLFGERGYDLITTNPAFSITHDLVEQALPLLTENGRLILLGRSELFQRQADEQWLKRFCPLEQWRIGGRIGFRGKGGGTDSNDLSWFVWSREGALSEFEELPAWHTVQLPVLPDDCRRWTVRPGTEDR